MYVGDLEQERRSGAGRILTLPLVSVGFFWASYLGSKDEACRSKVGELKVEVQQGLIRLGWCFFYLPLLNLLFKSSLV